MISRIRKAMDEKEQGFTLIELLVVMIIIGILAAIAIPVFLNQRKSAVDASVKSDLRTLATNIETVVVDTQMDPKTVAQVGKIVTITDNTAAAGTTPVTISTTDTTVDYKLNSTGGGYCLTGTNSKGKTAVAGLTYNSVKGGLGAACT